MDYAWLCRCCITYVKCMDFKKHIMHHKSPSGIGISVVVDMVVVVMASTAVSSVAVAVVFSSAMQHNAGG